VSAIYYIGTLVLAILSTVVGLLIRTTAKMTRKNDKVEAISEKFPDFVNRVLENERQIKTVWKTMDKRKEEASILQEEMEKAFKKTDIANDLMFRAISGIAKKVGADEVVELLDDKTIRIVKPEKK